LDRLKRERTPRRIFAEHKAHARKRKVVFLLTFEEWFKIWTDSGHWYEMGVGSDQYCMARYGDKGPYVIGNVRITTKRENCLEATLGKKHGEARRNINSDCHKGIIPSKETRDKMSQAHVGSKHWHSKVTEDQVREIRRIYNPDTFQASEISKIYKISRTTIYGILNRKSWTHI